MFKKGKSVARKLLAIDTTRGSSSLSSTSASQQQLSQQSPGCGAGGGGGVGGSDEIDDYTKIKQDPRMPLNVRQIFKLTKSWKAIARTMSRTGTAMFLT